MHFQTRCIHGGVHKDQQYNSVITPIYPSSTFYWQTVEKNSGYDYTRTANPTRRALEENLASLEGGIDARCTSTGMSAVLCAMTPFNPGDHIIAPMNVYGGTHRLFKKVLTEKGLLFSFVDMRDPQNIRKAVTPKTRGIWIETPSNPLMQITNIRAVVEIAHEINALTIADNTFLSPYLCQPLDMGVDLVMHSTTKYINGHSDVVGGAVIARDAELMEQISYYCNAMGLSCSPFDAWLVLRGVKTLPCRMEAQQKSAMRIAEFLELHPLVWRVHYPGLESHPQHELAKSQQSGFGAMLSFELTEGRATAERVCVKTQLFDIAESLGGIESLISFPVTMSHASMDEESRLATGISEALVRVSVGLENSDDLIEDLANALKHD